MHASPRSRRLLASGWFSILLATASSVFAVDLADTRMAADPAVSAERLVFEYAEDLWVSDRDGSHVRRLTSHPGVESMPRFSPDGRWICFTGRYEGNTDVYVIPSEGGVPRRLTWHPGDDVAQGFTPDGKEVLFTSPRQVYTRRYQQLFTVPIDGGFPTRLPIPNASKAVISPDGQTIAYLPYREEFHQWKNYRGGTFSRIHLFDRATQNVEVVPQPKGQCNDTDPTWLGGDLYFRSDRDGEFNLYRFERGTKTVTRLTSYSDYPVLHASAGGGRIAFEQAGYVHLLDPQAGAPQRLRLAIGADLVELRPRWAKGAKWMRDTSLSPSGNRAAIEFRGEILTLPREKGDDRNLTATPGVHERSPAWSPDGRWIACFSDAGGEYVLRLLPHDGKGEGRSIALEGAGFYRAPNWSPDSKKLSFVDNSHSIYIVDIESGRQVKVSSDAVYGPAPALNHAWSPDSRWLAYTRNSPTYFNQVLVYSLEDAKSLPITDGLADAVQPAFDAGGKYLYFLVSTDAGPVNDWFSQANSDLRTVQQIYLAVLAKGVASPLVKESDEEKPKETEKEKKEEEKGKSEGAGGKGEDGDGKGKEGKGTNAAPVSVVIDAEGMTERILALPAKAGVYADLQPGAANQVYYRRAASTDPGADSAVYRYDLVRRKEDTLLDAASGFEISADAKRALVQVKEDLHIVDLGDKLDLAKFKLKLDAVRVRVDPLAEWPQIFQEAWRVNRDYFYDPGFHGADWNAVRQKYEVFMPHLAVRSDLFRVIRWMLSELAVGHSYQSPGDKLMELESIPGGLLGADYEVANGRYRFQKVFGGLNWNADLRSPLTEPGVDVKSGEYLLAVEGRNLTPPENLYQRFERTAGRAVEITVGPNPDGTASRTVKVVPVENESDLRNRDWVEANLRRVTDATGGRVAYVYVPNTADLGHIYFKRYFFPQAHRDAIIIDERHNGGGSVADYYIDILRRPLVSHWTMRYGQDIKTPIAGIHGPKVMLIDETAGSGGDLLPWMFRRFELGTLIGKRTWGGLVGILGFPVLMDGGSVTAPNLAFRSEDGFRVENEGVAPDIEVDQTPKEVMSGRDPQLEKAIEVIMKQLDKTPPRNSPRPPFPLRARGSVVGGPSQP
ncbi:MAG: PD40 domain-containing protein [Verrucomicrobiales bacterium]|nr:PD40 domain-containing protein [Verrucomicrobiales bacterium]